jgi:hypothetical protein
MQCTVFLGFVGSSLVAFSINFAILEPLSVTGLAGVVILYGVLQLGRPKAWDLLR